jgi:hypothetical protein
MNTNTLNIKSNVIKYIPLLSPFTEGRWKHGEVPCKITQVIKSRRLQTHDFNSHFMFPDHKTPSLFNWEIITFFIGFIIFQSLSLKTCHT